MAEIMNIGARAAVMLLGTFHFDYPGRDAYKSNDRVDMLSPKRQREIEQVVERLAAFAPTKVAVETQGDRAAQRQEEYSAYRTATFDLTANEIHQLGFRLAARLGHERVHPIDVWGREYDPPETVEEYAKAHGEEKLLESAPLQDRFFAWRRWVDTYLSTHTLAEYLRLENAEENILAGHGIYFTGFFRIGGEESYVGVDYVTGWWYNRNLRIFRNIQRITESAEDRIVVIIGSGHLPILRHCVQCSPEHRVAEVADYL